MPRFVYAFAARVRARTEPVAVLHSKRKHVSSYSLYSKQHVRSFGPSRGIAYTNITHIVVPLSLCKYTLFPKVKIIYFATSAPSFDKNNNHKSHTVSRSAIIFRAETAATRSNNNNCKSMVTCSVISTTHFCKLQPRVLT